MDLESHAILARNFLVFVSAVSEVTASAVYDTECVDPESLERLDGIQAAINECNWLACRQQYLELSDACVHASVHTDEQKWHLYRTFLSLLSVVVMASDHFASVDDRYRRASAPDVRITLSWPDLAAAVATSSPMLPLLEKYASTFYQDGRDITTSGLMSLPSEVLDVILIHAASDATTAHSLRASCRRLHAWSFLNSQLRSSIYIDARNYHRIPYLSCLDTMSACPTYNGPPSALWNHFEVAMSLAPFPNLKSLTLSQCWPKTYRQLRHATQLTHLQLNMVRTKPMWRAVYPYSQSTFSDSVLAFGSTLPFLSTLRSLSLSFNNSDINAKADSMPGLFLNLTCLQALTYLAVENRIGESARIPGTPLFPTPGTMHLANAIEVLPSLLKLRLCHWGCPTESQKPVWASLCKSIGVAPVLASVQLKAVMMSPCVFEELEGMLPRFTKLRHLDLGTLVSSMMMTESLSRFSLARGIGELTKLTALDLGRVESFSLCCASLGKLLELKDLQMRFMGGRDAIMGEGDARLLDMLSSLQKLERFSVTHAEFTEQGGCDLAESLQHLSGLTSLHLSRCTVNMCSMMHLATALASLTRIEDAVLRVYEKGGEIPLLICDRESIWADLNTRACRRVFV